MLVTASTGVIITITITVVVVVALFVVPTSHVGTAPAEWSARTSPEFGGLETVDQPDDRPVR